MVGFFIGNAAGRVMLSRLVMVMAVWIAIPLIAGRLAAANISQSAGTTATAAAPVVVLVWALIRPARSGIKLTLLDGLFAWSRIVAIVCAGRLVFKVFETGFVLSPLVREGWTVALFVVAMTISFALQWWIERDERKAAMEALR
ncbi:hypothetical protein JW805_15400 [Roseomonas aeriglobus]|nr:hypothetical protein [Roseomonas aeriglobus]